MKNRRYSICDTCDKVNVCRYKNDCYCKNNSQRLKQISDVLIGKQFPWLSQMHYDDFYSIADEVLWKCLQQFDDSKDARFKTYLINCLIRKFKSRITYMNRKRRNNGISNVSLDALIDEGDTCLMNMVASCNTVESYAYSDKMKSYLGRLSELQRKVLFAIANGYSIEEIKLAFKITTKEFSDIYASIRAYRNVSLLY